MIDANELDQIRSDRIIGYKIRDWEKAKIHRMGGGADVNIRPKNRRSEFGLKIKISCVLWGIKHRTEATGINGHIGHCFGKQAVICCPNGL